MTADLAGFLLAHIAEDERLARDAEATWSQVRIHYGSSASTEQRFAREAFVPNINPWRVLAECEAKRRIVALLAECEAKRRIVAWHRLIDGLDAEDNPVRGCGNCIASGAEPPYLIPGPCMTVRLLALPYADHPDYRDEWRP